MGRPLPAFNTVIQTRITSLADEKLTTLCGNLGLSKADLLRIIVLELVRGDIDVKVALHFRSLEESEEEMRLLKKTKKERAGEELL